MKKISILLIFALLLVSCGKKEEVIKDNIIEDKEAQEIKDESKEIKEIEKPKEVELISYNKPNFNSSNLKYTPLNIGEFNVPKYEIREDLTNVENLGDFNFTDEEKALLIKNGFVVNSSDMEQIFQIYDENDYQEIPNFVTTDSVLHTFHMVFDYALRTLEQEYFYNDLINLNNNMLDELISVYPNITNPEAQKSILRSIGYFGVAQRLLDKNLPDNFPKEMLSIVEEELKHIEEESIYAESSLYKDVDLKISYSLFKPRGHYTRSDELKKYFQAMSWYGVIPIGLYNEIDGEIKTLETLSDAIIITNSFYSIDKEKAYDLWENIYSTTNFFVGEADDISCYELIEIIQKVYGENIDYNNLESGYDEFIKEAVKLPKPKIEVKKQGETQPIALRFMGQRYIMDSEIINGLVEPIARPVPTGLDVFGVLGSDRAKELIDNYLAPQNSWEEYDTEFYKLREQFNKDNIDYTKNMYTTWFYSLESLIGEYDDNYPLFMQNKAWEDKNLNTVLGSWAELRHDTILYGKQTMAQMGGLEMNWTYSGYIEPNPEFYNRVSFLSNLMLVNLNERKLLNENVENGLERLSSLCDELRDSSIKILKGENLTEEEIFHIKTYGGTLEYISILFVDGADSWYTIESKSDRHMGIIADIHTVLDGGYLEVGVGSPSNIYVIVSQNDNIFIAKGGVFDYYEFLSKERLTDEQWQEILETNPPERPEFLESFRVE